MNISPEIQYMIAVNLMKDFSIMTSDLNKLLDLGMTKPAILLYPTKVRTIMSYEILHIPNHIDKISQLNQLQSMWELKLFNRIL